MRNSLRRTLALSVLFLGATASFAAAAKALPCSDYISSGINDAPGTAVLIGSETISESHKAEAGGGAWGLTGKLETTQIVTYEVGYYRFSDGSMRRIDCRDYTFA